MDANYPNSTAYGQIRKNNGIECFELSENIRFVPGYLNGIRQPSIIFSVSVTNGPEKVGLSGDLLFMDILVFLTTLSGNTTDAAQPSREDAIDVLLVCIRTLLAAYHHPMFDDAKVLDVETIQSGHRIFRIQQPCLDFNAALAAVRICLELASMKHDNSERYNFSTKNFSKVFATDLVHLRRTNLTGFNTLQFLKAAHDLRVPWTRYSENTFQFGYGAKSRLLDSSFTDKTPVVSVKLSRNKLEATIFLRSVGLPVMDNILVGSVDMALTAANKLGYPVVVKPNDKDGGMGVSAFLTKPEQVSIAYGLAKKISDKILVEKFFEGKDYRIQIVDGEIQGVLERSPGGVIGDGYSTIIDLISQQNLERKHATDDRRYLHPINPDAECSRMLAIQGLSLKSVPEASAFIRLRGAANVASGGVPVLIDIADVHQDNKDLVLRAVRLMRLDVAGVDLLIPDARYTWLETGAAICEVNSQPQMFTAFHRPMLERLIGRDRGRIPICVVLEPQDQLGLGKKLFESLLPRLKSTGYVSSHELLLGQERIAAVTKDVFVVIRSLLTDPQLEALIVSLPIDFQLTEGWPFDQCDTLVLYDGASMADTYHNEAALKVFSGIYKSLTPRATYLTRNNVDLLQNRMLSDTGSLEILPDTGDLVDGSPDKELVDKIMLSLCSPYLPLLMEKGVDVTP